MASPHVEGYETGEYPERLPPFVLPAGLLVILLIHLIWAHWNDAPPVWDMAYHQLQGYRYLQAWRQGALLREFAHVSTHYPPLYYLIEAAVLGADNGGRYLAFLANLPAIFLLCLSGYALARYCLVKSLAGWASLLTLLFPMVAWVSRESLLDGLLAGWVALAVFIVVRSGFFQDLKWSLLFGVLMTNMPPGLIPAVTLISPRMESSRTTTTSGCSMGPRSLIRVLEILSEVSTGAPLRSVPKLGAISTPR